MNISEITSNVKRSLHHHTFGTVPRFIPIPQHLVFNKNITAPLFNSTTENTTATYRGSYIPVIGGIHFVTIYAKDSPPENNTNNLLAGNFSVIGNATGFVEQCANNTLDGNSSDCDSSLT